MELNKLLLLMCSTATGTAELCWALGSRAAWRTGVLMMKRIARRSSDRSCSHQVARQMCRLSLSCCRSSWRPSTKRLSEFTADGGTLRPLEKTNLYLMGKTFKMESAQKGRLMGKSRTLSKESIWQGTSAHKSIFKIKV